MAIRREVFDRPRWLVVTGAGELERYAAAEAAALVQQHVPYVLQAFVGGCDRSRLKAHNLLLVGTPQSNPLVGALVGEGKVALPRRPQGLSVGVVPSPFNSQRQALVLAGSDERGVLHAARDFEHYCYDPYAGALAPRAQPLPHVARAPARGAAFHQPLPAWRLSGWPRVPRRGIWTWGHVVHDYRAFLENMSRWKLNTLICWNDFAPLNAREVVEHAHALGIEVIWGYTWCWGEPVDPNDPGQLARWRRRIIATYEDQYLPLGGDGIYFQTFTETHRQRIGRKTIAELAVRWVNDIAGSLLDRHPGLTVQFGVHAISIRSRYRRLAAVDPRVSIVWEDAGCFPFSYDVGDVTTIAETARYTRKLSGLRGRSEDVGFVLKGMPNLNWATFEHQLGPFFLGRADRDFVRRRTEGLEARWKQVEHGWRKNLPSVCRVIRSALAGRPRKLTLTGLVEDALWERRMFLPPCLLAEAMWNPYEPPDEILAKVSATRDASCLA